MLTEKQASVDFNVSRLERGLAIMHDAGAIIRTPETQTQKLLGTSASLLGTSALLVVTRSY